MLVSAAKSARRTKISTGERRRTLSPPRVPKLHLDDYVRQLEMFQKNLVRATTVSSQLYGTVSSHDLVGLINDLERLAETGSRELEAVFSLGHCARVFSVHLLTVHTLLLHAATPLVLVTATGAIVWMMIRCSSDGVLLRVIGDLILMAVFALVAGGSGAVSMAIAQIAPKTVAKVQEFLAALASADKRSPEIGFQLMSNAAFSLAFIYEDASFRLEFCRGMWLAAACVMALELVLCAWAGRLMLFCVTLLGCIAQGLATGQAAIKAAPRGELLDCPPRAGAAEFLLALMVRSPVLNAFCSAVIAGWWPAMEAQSQAAYFNIWAEQKLKNAQAVLKDVEKAREVLFAAWKFHAQQNMPWGGGGLGITETVGGITSGVSSMASGAKSMIFGSSSQE